MWTKQKPKMKLINIKMVRYNLSGVFELIIDMYKTMLLEGYGDNFAMCRF